MIGDLVADMAAQVAPDGTLWVRISPTTLASTGKRPRTESCATSLTGSQFAAATLRMAVLVGRYATRSGEPPETGLCWPGFAAGCGLYG